MGTKKGDWLLVEPWRRRGVAAGVSVGSAADENVLDVAAAAAADSFLSNGMALFPVKAVFSATDLLDQDKKCVNIPVGI